MQLMKLNQQQNMVRVVTFNFSEPADQVYTLRLLMSSDQPQKHVYTYVHKTLYITGPLYELSSWPVISWAYSTFRVVSLLSCSPMISYRDSVFSFSDYSPYTTMLPWNVTLNYWHVFSLDFLYSLQFGIVHFNSVMPQCIKALILVWNEKTMQFTGLIPMEQVRPALHSFSWAH